jgi:hypothetical protein
MVYSAATVVDDMERREQSDFAEQAKTAAMERRAEDKSDEVKTVADLAVYVAGAWDTGGPVYCATKTWFSGLSDAFARLAAQEGLSAVERRTAEQSMRATLPPCRNCGCQQVKKSGARGGSQDDDTPQMAPKLRAKSAQSSIKKQKTLMETTKRRYQRYNRWHNRRMQFAERSHQATDKQQQTCMPNRRQSHAGEGAGG